MSLVAVGGMPLTPIGHANRQGIPSVAALGTTTLDAAKEAMIMVGRFMWADFGTHTVNTTGSSSIGWRTGTVTFANVGTTVVVGIAPVDAATGPPTRASNASDVISFDVSASFTGGGGGITTAAWQTSVPTTGTKTIATGDLVAIAVQMTARGGAADSVTVAAASSTIGTTQPAVTSYTGGSYANVVSLPNAVVVASDGTLGFIFGSYVASIGTTAQSWNSGSATKEYGNILRFPVPVRAYGIVIGCDFVGNTDVILYSTPLGTPGVEKSVSVDLNTVGSATATTGGFYPFTSAFDLAANTDYAVIAKPTSATTISMNYLTRASTTHHAADPLGANCYAVSRASGAFAAQNSSLDKYPIGLLVGAFDNAVSTTPAMLINSEGLVG